MCGMHVLETNTADVLAAVASITNDHRVVCVEIVDGTGVTFAAMGTDKLIRNINRQVHILLA